MDTGGADTQSAPSGFLTVPVPATAARFAGMRGLLTFLTVCAAACLAGGCFHSDYHRSGYTEDGKYWSERVADHVSEPYIDELRGEILSLGDEGEVDPGEAQLLADTAVRYGMVLARSYHMVRPIEIHNAMVNLGLRKRGLCYQTAEDMYVRLRELDLQTLRLHWGVAHRGDLWLEHSGVIVTARDRPFSEGLVLDAWRHSGRLRWARVGGDRYPWVEMFKGKFPELREQAEEDQVQLAAERLRPDRARDTAPVGPVYRVESRVAETRVWSGDADEGSLEPAVTTPRPPTSSDGRQSSAIVTRPRSE